MKRHGAWSNALLIGLLILITGCKSQSLSFVSESELPYDKDFNVCSLVDTVNDQRIPSLLNDGNEIHYQGDVILCNSNNVKLDPNVNLSIDFDYNGSIFTKEIMLTEAVAEKPVVEVPKAPIQQTPPVEVSPAVEPPQTDPIEEAPSEEQTEPELSEPDVPYVPEVPTSNIGEYREFVVSETVSIHDARNACIAYASQYTNFSQCLDVRDEVTKLIIKYITV